MSSICPHEFEKEDPHNPGYSLTEFDLAAQLNLTVRRNLRQGMYEVVSLQTGEVRYASPSLQETVETANHLEGRDHIQIVCGPLCPRKRTCG